MRKKQEEFHKESELEREALMWCALRLDGWLFLKEAEGQDTGDFSPYVDPIVAPPQSR